MGVVQGLARRGILPDFHYLSTVSGGGYTGSWLSAWMARDGAASVHEQLRGGERTGSDCEPAPLRHIRTYSYYLDPSFGLLSADTWTLLATIGRNIFLIWLVTLPVIAAALMVPRLMVAGPMTTLSDWNHIGLDPADVLVVLAVLGTVLAVVAISFVQRHLYSYTGREDGGTPSVSLRQFLSWCLVPLVVAMVALAQAWEMGWSFVRLHPEATLAAMNKLSRREWAHSLIAIAPDTIGSSLHYAGHAMSTSTAAVAAGVAFWLVVYLAAWAIAARGRRVRPVAALLSALSGALAGAIGGYGSARLFGVLQWTHPPEFYATLAVPISLLGLLMSKQLVVGLASRQMTDAERESNARFSAWLLIVIVAWVAIVGISLYGPLLTLQLLGSDVHVGRKLLGVGGTSGLLSALLATSSGLSGTPGTRTTGGGLRTALQKLAIALAAPLFAVCVIVLVSLLNTSTLVAACAQIPSWCPSDDSSGVADLFFERGSLGINADFATPHVVLLLMAALLLLGYVLGRLIDTNRFSLHAMYRSRLVRTFLGGSRPAGERKPNPFTGFDENDDLPMSALWPATRDGTASGPPSAGAHPPLHVLNLTLNMVAGTELAMQGRKATSFTVTPLHAGSAAVGYRRTSVRGDVPCALYGGDAGISLGTAMAISGAAASPNAGYHSSPAVTFLMTLFNARLGWWLGNPGPVGERTYTDDEPRLALLPILEEMFGRTTDTSPYVYLSDGGHFENLGLYEMVRRRCRFIVVSDAGCDPTGSYDDLGGAIRKIRIDFGIPIEFDSGFSIYPRSVTPAPADAAYWATARIRYSCVDDAPDCDGLLLYIKPAFYGREPRDVYNYATSTPDFPHESTANQFFGEAQFESYRALGSHAIDQMCEHEFGVSPDSDAVVQRDRLEEWVRPLVAQP